MVSPWKIRKVCTQNLRSSAIVPPSSTPTLMNTLRNWHCTCYEAPATNWPARAELHVRRFFAEDDKTTAVALCNPHATLSPFTTTSHKNFSTTATQSCQWPNYHYTISQNISRLHHWRYTQHEQRLCLLEKRSELTAVGRSATLRTDSRFTGGSPLTGYSARDDADMDDNLGILQ